MNKLKIGIIGVGSRGAGTFAQNLKDMPQCELTAFCDNNALRLKIAADNCNVSKRYTDYREMLKNEKFDGVIITVPDYLHQEIAVAALEAGCNVLLDKPLAISVEGCEAIIETAKKSGKCAMIGFNLRHHVVLKRLKKLITDGVLGRIFMIENQDFYNGGRTYMARWNRKKANTGSLWIHKGSHDFDTFNWLLDFPKPVKVSAFSRVDVLNPDNLPFERENNIEPGPTCSSCHYNNVCPDVCIYKAPEWSEEAAKLDGYHKDLCIYLSEKDTHDNGIAIVEYDNGAKASHAECFVSAIDDRVYTLCGTRGQAVASVENRQIKVYPRWSKEVQTIDLPAEKGGHGGADTGLIDYFLKVLAGEEANSSTVIHGMLSTAIGEAAEISRTESRMVFVDELFKK